MASPEVTLKRKVCYSPLAVRLALAAECRQRWFGSEPVHGAELRRWKR